MPCSHCGLALSASARFCPGCGHALGGMDAASPGAGALRDVRVVTILTARLPQDEDLENADPESGRHALEAFYRLVGEAVGASGGIVDRLAGPVAVARYGAPVIRTDDPQCAVSAARRIAAGAVPAPDGGMLRPAVGVATGDAMAGHDVRPGGGGAYTVRGEVVDVSRLLCETAAAAQVLADEETALRAREAFAFEPAADSGAAEPARRAFRLEGAVGLGTDSGPLHGREAERLKLEGAALAALAGTVQVVVVAGPEGLGKSRLAGELWSQFRDRAANARLVVARAASYHGDAPYALAAHLVEGWAGLAGTDPTHRQDHLERWARDLGRPDPARTAHLVGWLFRAAAAALSGIDRPEAAMRAELCAAVAAAARREPLLLILEDLQRADAPSRSWLGELLAAVAGEMAQLAVVCTATQDPAIDIPSELESVRIQLRPLDHVAAGAMVASRLGLESAPESWPQPLRTLTADLVRKAGGNPFFLSELVRTCIAAQVLVREEDTWTVKGDTGRLALPATLRASVSAKLDRLEPPARRLLGMAAALGTTFDTVTLGAIARLDPAPGLEVLVREAMIDPIDAPQDRFAFVQEIFRAAAYEALLGSERAAIHGRIARFLEESHEESLDAFAGEIADHLEEAGELGRAASYAYRAGTHATDAAKYREAALRLRQCADLVGQADPGSHDVSLAGLLEDLADVEERLGEYQEAIIHVRQLLETPEAHRDGLVRVRLLRRLGALQERRGAFDDALSILQEAVVLARSTGSPQDQAGILAAMGMSELRRGKLDDAIRFGEEALELLGSGASLADRATEGYVNSILGIAHYRRASWEASIAHHRKALAIREDLRDVPGTMRSLNNLGNTYADYGQVEMADKLYRRALEMARRESSVPDLAQVLNNLGHLLLLRGDPALAERHFAESATLSGQIKDERSLGLAEVNLGLAQLELGRLDEARRALGQGHDRLEALGYFEQHVEILVGLARIADEEADAARARKILQRARYHADEARQAHLQALVWRASGEHHLRHGATEPAIAALTEAVKAHGDPPAHPLESARTQRLLAVALDKAGRLSEAAQALAAADRAPGAAGL